MAIFRKIIFNIKLLLSDEYNRAAVYSEYLGVKFGDNVLLTGKIGFGSEPFLITIGNNVTIAHGTTFHNHDGGLGVLRLKYPHINIFKKIIVGDNVFIGSYTTILPGITIGNNVIIGASSVITKDVPNGVVVAGVPARVIKTLAEYEEKSLKEAVFINEPNRKARNEKIKQLFEALK